MDGRGGCCIARYAGDGGVYHISQVDQIMLRFRPIAPKPATGGSVPPLECNSEVYSNCGRGKRKYSKENKNNVSSNENTNNSKRCNRKRRVSNREEKRNGYNGDTVVTLPLLPETPDRKDSPARGYPEEAKKGQKFPVWLSFGSSSSDNRFGELMGDGLGCGSDPGVVTPEAVRLVGSCVTVECVTETWVEGGGLGSTDEERRRNLGRDTCPGFISDGMGRVTWTNGAYREMVGQCGGMMVWLVMKERAMLTYPAFTCRVRLQYACGRERNSLILPCDVWRMEGGGFAWRLDVKAALCLGR
ncbi:uncharacterized protein LOC110822924 [Carica papaya]|uniref:uncharacterized protein LOC110822924 n=1 Tax=Carica papaya TaxID=3649 RepID=UPI000B8C96B1|nr:uncharacterized protein LOC110822924 [Carica papaya]